MNEQEPNQQPKPRLPDYSEDRLSAQDELGGLPHELTEEQLKAMVRIGLGGMAHRRRVRHIETARENEELFGLSGQGHSTPEERKIIVNMSTLAADLRDKAAADGGKSRTEIAAQRRAREERRRKR